MIERIILAVLALVLGVIGAGAAFAPALFYGSYGISVSGLPNLASELRGTGVALLLLAMAVAAGAVWRRWAFAAAVVAGLVALGYALGRGISAVADGAPDASIVAAAIIELVLAGAAAWVAVRTRPRDRLQLSVSD